MKTALFIIGEKICMIYSHQYELRTYYRGKHFFQHIFVRLDSPFNIESRLHFLQEIIGATELND